jgi:hypothetical protein
MRFNLKRAGAALAAVGTMLVMSAGPAEAATPTLVYRSTENVRIIVPGRTCVSTDGTAPSTELTTAIQLGQSKTINERYFRCGTGSTRVLAAVKEHAAWNASDRWADASHTIMLGEERSTGEWQFCSTFGASIGSTQTGYVHEEFAEQSQSLSTSGWIRCSWSGYHFVTFSLVESWSAWS